MYCRQCGAELTDGAKFCSACGTNQEQTSKHDGVAQAVESGKATIKSLSQKAEKSALLSDGIAYWKQFFSPAPVQMVVAAAGNNSCFWILPIAVNCLLFAFSSCRNLARLVSYIYNSFIHATMATLKGSIPGGMTDLFGLESKIPTLDLPPLYSLFMPFIVLALLVFVLEFIGIYIPLHVAKCKPTSTNNLLNVLSVSVFPMTAACIINIPLGLVYPPLTICIFVLAIILHLLFVYEGVNQFAELKIPTVWRVGLLGFLICIVLLFASGMVSKSLIAQLLQMLEGYAGNYLKDALGGFGGLW